MSRGRAVRTPSDVDHHLDWFFNDAPAAVSGLRSSWALIDGPGPIGAAPGSTTVPAHRLSAARRESDVASRLERLTPEDRVVLHLAHSRVCPWPVQAAEDRRGRDYRATLWSGAARAFGRQVAALLPTTEPAQDAFLALLEKADTGDGRELVFDVAEMDGRDAAWRRGDDPRVRLAALLSRGFPDWLYSPARESDHPDMLRGACADARLALRRAQAAWATVAPVPDAEGRVRQRERRRGASLVELVRPAPDEPLEMFAPAWEAVAAE